MQYLYIFVRMAKWERRKYQVLAKCGETRTLTWCWWDVYRLNHLGKNCLMVSTTTDPTTLLLSICQIGMNICASKNIYKNIHSSTIYNSLKLETTQMPINNRTDKYVVIYLPMKMNKLQEFPTIWTNITNIMLNKNKLDATECIYCIYLYEVQKQNNCARSPDSSYP